jgi:acyl carrier protein
MTMRKKIRAFIEESFVLHGSNDVLKDGESLMDTGRVDSTGVLSLATFVEETFEVEVDDDELVPGNFDTIDRIVNYLTRKGVGRAA